MSISVSLCRSAQLYIIMKFQFQLTLAFFAFITIMFLLFRKLRTNGANSFSTRFPPGPKKLFFIGNIHQLVGSLPHRKLKELADEHGPIIYLKLGEVPIVVVSSSDIAKEVMKTHDIKFAQRPHLLACKILTYNFVNVGFSPYGPYWRQLRKLCATEVLGVKKVRSFRSIREEEAEELVRTINSTIGYPINLRKKLPTMAYRVTARAAFGRKCKHEKEFIQLVVRGAKLVSGFSVSDLYPSSKILPIITGFKYQLEKLHEEGDIVLENILTSHANKKRSASEGNGEECLVETLLRIQERNDLEVPLTRNGIKGIIMDMFGAGGETSSTLIEWAMSEMLKNPRVMKKAQAEVRKTYKGKGTVDEENLDELKYLKLIIMEALRLHPPAPLLLPRENVEPCVISGYDIPAHTRVIINAWAIARDAKYWYEPENFSPERFSDDSSMDYTGKNFNYIPFGAGRRICPGIEFAIPNMVLPLAQLLYHFNWELADGREGQELDMSESFGVTVKRKNDLILIPTQYTADA
ncbi:unnamed protein product [Rhodiola kirilowii]